MTAIKFVQDIWYHFRFQKLFAEFVQTECNLLKTSHFVKKITLNINLIKVAHAKGKINENQKRSENKTKTKGKTRPSAKALAKISLS